VIRHTMFFQTRDDLTPEQTKEFLDRCAQIGELSPDVVKNFHFGKNFNLRDKTYTHVYTADFDDKDALEAWQAAGVHKQFVGGLWRNSIAGRTFASIEI
jgi:hypothetical protein